MKSAARGLALGAASALLLTQAIAAAVELADRSQVQALLASGTPCCVIDARSDAERGKLGVAHALAYRKGMKINPTGAVVVIADTDARARQIGEALARTSAARQVVAVKGGAPTWLAAQEAAPGGPAGVRSFIIPTNTCEQGPPLQVLSPGRK